jgi:hypothetical protein
VRRRARTEVQSAGGGSRASRASAHDWYSGELRPKVARAVAEGRVDAGRADELHRLMTELLEDGGRNPGDVAGAPQVKAVVRLDGRATR